MRACQQISLRLYPYVPSVTSTHNLILSQQDFQDLTKQAETDCSQSCIVLQLCLNSVSTPLTCLLSLACSKIADPNATARISPIRQRPRFSRPVSVDQFVHSAVQVRVTVAVAMKITSHVSHDAMPVSLLPIRVNLCVATHMSHTGGRVPSCFSSLDSCWREDDLHGLALHMLVSLGLLSVNIILIDGKFFRRVRCRM